MPEPERRKAVLKLSLMITLAIAVIWGVVLFVRVKGTDFTFKDGFKDNSPSLKEMFSDFSGRVENIFESADKGGATTSTPAQ